MKNLLKIIGFAAGFFLLLILFDNLFNNSYWYKKGYVSNRDAIIKGIDMEKPGQIDVLCIGNSLGFCGVDPMELYKDCGITSYNASTALQVPVESYYLIRTVLKRQPVKVILWETHNLTRKRDPVQIGSERLAEDIRFRHPFTRYHGVWKNAADGFHQRPYFKGFLLNESVSPYKGDHFYDPRDTGIMEVSREQKYYFDKIQKLCRKEHIKLVLYANPSPVCYDKSIHNGIEALARKAGVDFLDANMEMKEIGIDWNKDTYDEGDHLNLTGTRKMTDYLAGFLKKECRLKDHRPDPAYRSWDALYTVYEREVEAMKGTNYAEVERKRRKEKWEKRWGNK